MDVKTRYDFRLLDSDEVDFLYQNQKLSQCFKSFPDGTKKPVGETTLEEIPFAGLESGRFETDGFRLKEKWERYYSP